MRDRGKWHTEHLRREREILFLGLHFLTLVAGFSSVSRVALTLVWPNTFTMFASWLAYSCKREEHSLFFQFGYSWQCFILKQMAMTQTAALMLVSSASLHAVTFTLILLHEQLPLFKHQVHLQKQPPLHCTWEEWDICQRLIFVQHYIVLFLHIKPFWYLTSK